MIGVEAPIARFKRKTPMEDLKSRSDNIIVAISKIVNKIQEIKLNPHKSEINGDTKRIYLGILILTVAIVPKKIKRKIADVPMSGSIKTRINGTAAAAITSLKSFIFTFLFSNFESIFERKIIKKIFINSEG
jgi:hypothetical protein